MRGEGGRAAVRSGRGEGGHCCNMGWTRQREGDGHVCGDGMGGQDTTAVRLGTGDGRVQRGGSEVRETARGGWVHGRDDAM